MDVAVKANLSRDYARLISAFDGDENRMKDYFEKRNEIVRENLGKAEGQKQVDALLDELSYNLKRLEFINAA